MPAVSVHQGSSQDVVESKSRSFQLRLFGVWGSLRRARSARQAVVGDELLVHEALSDECGGHVRHLSAGVVFALVLLAGELVDVAVEVLR